MKRLIIAFMLLSGCSQDNHERLVKEAKAFCRCHKGVAAFSYNENSYSLLCVDGMESKGNGDMQSQHFFSDCGK